MKPAIILCEKCGAYLIEYAREQIDDDQLVRFQHTGEQGTDCDGYFQCRASEFEAQGVEEEQ